MSLSDTTEPTSGPGPEMEGRRGPSPMMFLSIGLGILMAVSLITVVSIFTGGASKTGSTTTLFTHESIDGRTVEPFSLPALETSATLHVPWTHGTPTVLVFFASWCTACQTELPAVAHYESTHAHDGVAFFGMDSNDVQSLGAAFARAHHVKFPSAYDNNGTVANGTFFLSGLPDTVFVNAKGVVKELVSGPITNAQLDAGIREIQS